MDLKLKNKVVVVTGSTGDIGFSICSAFLNEGSVVIPFYRDPLKLDKISKLSRLKKNENKVHPVKVNLESESSISAGINRVIKKFGKIDVLVNSIGYVIEGPFLLMDERHWDKVIRVNLYYITRMIRVVLKHMFKERSGSIITISSVLGQKFGRGAVAYSVAKAGINRLTEALALEVGKKGIRVNAVCPGVIETKMSKGLTYHLSDKILERTPLQRYGRPDEVSNAVLFLASEKTASFITGHKLFVDGGIDI